MTVTTAMTTAGAGAGRRRRRPGARGVTRRVGVAVLAVMAAASLSGVVGGTAQAATGSGARAMAPIQRQVLGLVNSARARAGCRALRESPRLDGLAQAYSVEMAVRGFFSHTDPDGRTPWDRARQRGISRLGGENIAEGQPDARAVMAAWMASPPHRANILDCGFRTLGIGADFGSGGPWWTQDFAR